LSVVGEKCLCGTQPYQKSKQVSGIMEFDHETLMQLAGEVYLAKIIEDQICVAQDRPRQRLFQQLYNFMFFKFGVRYVSELVLEVCSRLNPLTSSI
jgi:DTW domain-containing protein YfiP